MLFPGCRVLIIEEICQGQNGARNENWPRPPELAKFGSEFIFLCRVSSDLENLDLSGNYDIKVWFIRKIELGFSHRLDQIGILWGMACT